MKYKIILLIIAITLLGGCGINNESSIEKTNIIAEYDFISEYETVENALFSKYVPPPNYTNFISMYKYGELTSFNLRNGNWNYTIEYQQAILNKIEDRLYSNDWACVSKNKTIASDNSNGCLYLVLLKE
jgi:hypothetical protein